MRWCVYNLPIRGFDFVDWCIMCHCNGETMDHLLLHCRKAYQLWSFVFRTFGISWVPSWSVADFLFGWWNWLGKHSSSIWNLVPLYLMWCIWRERSRWTFEDLDIQWPVACSFHWFPFWLVYGLGTHI